MAYEAGTAFVSIVPEFKRFAAELKTGLAAVDEEINVGLNPNLSAFRAKLKTGLSAIKERIKVDADVDVDSRRAEAKIGAFAKRFKRTVTAAIEAIPEIELKADSTPAERELYRLRARLKSLQDVEIGVDLSAEQVYAEAHRLGSRLRDLARESPEIRARFDAGTAFAGIEALKAEVRRLDGMTAEVNVRTDRGGILGAIRGFLGLTSAIGGAGDAAGNAGRQFGTLSTGFFGLNIGMRAISPAAGAAVLGFVALQVAAAALVLVVAILPGLIGAITTALFALPGAISVATAGLGTLALGFMGVVKALGVLQQEDDKTTRSGVSNAKAREAVTKRIRSATQSLEDAQRSQARTAKAGLEQVATAERNLISAVDRSRRAQQDLNRAREEAVETLQQLQFSIRDAAISEKEAALDLADARQALAEGVAGGVQGRELERLQIAVQRAALGYDEAKDRVHDLNEEGQEWARSGIEGSDGVQAALEGVRSAQEGVAEAQRDLASAQERAAQANEDAARSVQRAQEQLADAMSDTGDVGASAAARIEDAFRGLSPAGAEFTRFLWGLKDQFDELRRSAEEGLLPGVQRALGNLLVLFGPLKQGLHDIGQGLGGLFEAFSRSAGSLQGFGQIDTILQNTAGFLRDIAPMVEIGTRSFLTLSEEGSKALGPLADTLNRFAQNFDDMVDRLAGEGILGQAFAGLNTVLDSLLRLFVDMMDIGARWMAQLGDPIGKVIDSIGESMKILAPTLGDVSGELLLLIADFLPDFAKILKELLPMLPDWLRFMLDLFRILGPIIVMLERHNGMLLRLMNLVLRPLIPMVEGLYWVFDKLFDLFEWAVDQVIAGLVAGLEWLASKLVEVYDAVGGLQGLWGTAWGFIGGVLQGTWDSVLGPVLGWLDDRLHNVINATQWLWDKASWVWGAVAGFVEEGVGDAIEFIDRLSEMPGRIVGWFEGLGTDLKDILVSAFKGAINAVLTVWNNLGIPEFTVKMPGPIPDVHVPGLSLPDIPLLEAQGDVLLPMAAGGGLTPMSGSLARVVRPNTWRVIGDRMTGAEAFIPLDGSARSVQILAQAAKAMGFGITAMAQGGLLGAVTGRAQVGVEGSADAFTASVQGLTQDALAPLADELQTTTTPALTQLQKIIDANTDATLTATGRQGAAFQGLADLTASASDGMQGSVNLLRDVANAAWVNMRATADAQAGFIVNTVLTGLNAGMYGVQTVAQNTYSAWASQLSAMQEAAARPIRWIMNWPLGNEGIAKSWNVLDDQFKLNKHLTMPVPGFASGGIAFPHRYTPGRDIGYVGVSGGEPIMRPEWGRAVGTDYINAANAAARTGGISGVKAFLNSWGPGGRAEGAGKLALMRRFPLDGPVLGHFAYGGVAPHVAAAGDEVVRMFGPMPGGIGGVGSRKNASDHPIGLALDFMTLRDKLLGDRVASYLMANAQRLLVKYLIWQQQINEGGGWSMMPDRGSITANHFDHVHASFLRIGQLGHAFGGAMFDFTSVVEDAFKRTSELVGDVTRWFGDSDFVTGIQSVAQQAVDALKNKAFELIGAIGTSAGMNGPVKDIVRAVSAKFGWGDGPQWNALDRLIQKESSWNPTAQNPRSTAFGLYQFLDSTWGTVGGYKTSDPGLQAEFGNRYIRNRYGDPVGALNFHLAHNWYDEGGDLPPGYTLAYNGTGKTESVFTDRMLKDIRDHQSGVTFQNYQQLPHTASPQDFVDAMRFEMRRKGVHVG